MNKRDQENAGWAQRPSRPTSRRTSDPGGAPSGGPIATQLLALQRSAGNRAVARAVEEARHEHGPDCGHENPVESVQRSTVHEVLRSPGAPVDPPLRSLMEAELQADFGNVRIHTDPVAQRSAVEMGAHAYTSGNHVVVGPRGADLPTLAHEFAHVKQQQEGEVSGTDNGEGLRISHPDDPYEREATAIEQRVRAGGMSVQRLAAPPGTPGGGVPSSAPSDSVPVQRSPSYGDEMDWDGPQIIDVEPDWASQVAYSEREAPSYSGGGGYSYAGAGPSYQAYQGGQEEMEMDPDTPQIIDVGPGSSSRAPHRRGGSSRDPRIIDARPGGGSSSRRPSTLMGMAARPRGVRKPDPPSGQPVVGQLLGIAERVMRGVKGRIKYGAANQVRSAAATGGGLGHMLASVRDPDLRRPVSDFRESLGQSAAAAEAVGVGNCGEHAAMAFCLLNRETLPPGVSIWHASLSIDHAFVAVGYPDRPAEIVVLDAWQNNAVPVLAKDFRFPFLVNGKVTSEAARFKPDGKDYLRIGRDTIDMDILTETMDTTGPPIDPGEFAGQSHMWDHEMPTAPDYDSYRRPRHSSRREHRSSGSRRSALEDFLTGRRR
ncbi:eCIS core domain-containing protein [Streptomyces alkaliphilus]|uniref:eCIS core domain-containing protein n=1 Tax=Streptomyces alkaliphilus TaxID=1472722 RepID=UPI002B219934|nr:DUF4157 domain-containing protein [Streptomyces alkaliphilus]